MLNPKFIGLQLACVWTVVSGFAFGADYPITGFVAAGFAVITFLITLKD